MLVICYFVSHIYIFIVYVSTLFYNPHTTLACLSVSNEFKSLTAILTNEVNIFSPFTSYISVQLPMDLVPEGISSASVLYVVLILCVCMWKRSKVPTGVPLLFRRIDWGILDYWFIDMWPHEILPLFEFSITHILHA